MKHEIANLSRYVKPIAGLLTIINPQWKILATSADKNKSKLLDMMNNNNRPMPPRNSPLGMALRNYTSIRSAVYDYSFDQAYRTSSWWKNSPKNLSTLYKEQLIEMMKAGAPKPSLKTKLGRALQNYTTKSVSNIRLNRDVYDASFDKIYRF